MKKIYLIMAIFIILLNILSAGCAVLNHEKTYYQVIECKNSKPIVRTFYGTDTEYMKIKRNKNIFDIGNDCGSNIESNTTE